MRIMRTCNRLGIDCVGVYEDADAGSLHVVDGGADVLEAISSYTDQDALLFAAKNANADSVHPGYGFLSEHAGFAKRCVDAGLVWLGPDPSVMDQFSRKDCAREVCYGVTCLILSRSIEKCFSCRFEVAISANVPVTPGSPVLSSEEECVDYAKRIGFPIILKPAGGGGGIGMQVCWSMEEVWGGFKTASDVAGKFFGDASVFMEKYIASSHHIEVQVFGDGSGNVIHLGERECSVQRRQQKVIEETPSPTLSPSQRERVWQAAVDLCKHVKYGSAGTVEFLYDAHTGEFYFLEVNTRLQVEHGVTEMVNGVDIVEMMIRQGHDSTRLDLSTFKFTPKGSAIQLRIYAEDPLEDFKPAPGLLQEFHMPREEEFTRFETWAYAGCYVTPSYDPLIVKILQWGENRQDAISRLRTTVSKTRIGGTPNNLEYLSAFLASPAFLSGETPCDVLKGFTYESSSFMLLDAPPLGLTVQDFPGRTHAGLWRIGVPPSGPMDHLNARLANSIVGNEDGAAVLEMTMKGFSIKTRCPATICVTGAEAIVRVNNVIVSRYAAHSIRAGSTVTVGDVDATSAGVRCYFAVRGGVDVPLYLGSRSTFTGGKLGGHQCRDLQAGDVLPIGHTVLPLCQSPKGNNIASSDRFASNTTLASSRISSHSSIASMLQASPPRRYGSTTVERFLPAEYWPLFPFADVSGVALWEIGVTLGPHSAPDFLTYEDVNLLFESEWTVHHNSNRLGMRLKGPKLSWARHDGGDGGNHPSNIVDCAYALGTLNFTGDSPVIITHDGPSLGGFVCPVTVVQSELWKAGQLKAGDLVRFRRMNIKEAVSTRLAQNHFIRDLKPCKSLSHPCVKLIEDIADDAVLYRQDPGQVKIGREWVEHPGYVVRLAGDSNVLVEYGPGEMKMGYRVRLHFLEEKLIGKAIPGLLETLPGVRSLQIRHNPIQLPLSDLLHLIRKTDACINTHNAVVPSRVFHLPLAWDHSGVDVALQRYQNGVRADAPYLPRNIDFIAEANGLSGEDEVKAMVYRASYLCMGLGDVYLGAPCAVPVDPRDRVVVPKFNPARTWTQEGTVGLGGSYMCIYPMDSPGGYQLVGRTIPIWNSYPHRKNTLFTSDKPWLLRMFDQVRFYEVGESELEKLRVQFKQGVWEPKMSDETFDLSKYKDFACNDEMKSEISTLKAKRYSAAESLHDLLNVVPPSPKRRSILHDFDSDCIVSCPMNAVVANVLVEIGDNIEKGDAIITLEAMKMEFEVKSEYSGKVLQILTEKGARVDKSQALVILEAALIERSTNATREDTLENQRHSLSVTSLLQDYTSKAITPTQIINQCYDQIESCDRPEVFIHMLSREEVVNAAKALESNPHLTPETCPLYGIPFVVKDNIDVANVPTTAACEEFKYIPNETAPCIQRLLNAGALLLGKTNLDQFATGLNGTRSPYGAVRNSFYPEYISGGSSSGSAVAVALGFCAFSIGTDTAGSGRVPAQFNNIVGLKSTLGRVPTVGVVPACKSLDVVTVFGLTSEEVHNVTNVMSDKDKICSLPERFELEPFRFGVPAPEQLEFYGNDDGRLLLEEACTRLEKLGGTRVEINFSSFQKCATCLYESAHVAQRLEATAPLFYKSPQAIRPSIRNILQTATKYTALDVFKAQEETNLLKIDADKVWSDIDILVTPTAPRIYTIEEMIADPLKKNSHLG